MRRSLLRFLLTFATLAPAGFSYSVLSHEALVDATWDKQMVPLLLKRFPDTGKDEITKARAYAYGGSIIQDMGYYPFSNKLFSDLLHYVRPAGFVLALAQEAQNVDEYAFALGAISHYAADIHGHKTAVNPSVAILYPKKRAEFGNIVTYEDFPTGHIQTEFSFDVLQVSQGLYVSDAYHSFIGFEVSKPLLERVVAKFYGLEMKDIFKDEDMAIGTYRYAVSGLIPKMTKVALSTREHEMTKANPGFKRSKFLYRMTRRDYEKDWGTKYYKPSAFDRFLGWVISVMPKVGPLRALAFKNPTPQVDRLFLESFKQALTNLDEVVAQLRTGHIELQDCNLDTGDPVRPGAYHLSDTTYARLAEKLAAKPADQVPVEMREHLLAYFRDYSTPPTFSKDDRKELAKAALAVQSLKQTSAPKPATSFR